MHTDSKNHERFIPYELILEESPDQLIFISPDDGTRIEERIVIHRFNNVGLLDRFKELHRDGVYYRKSKKENLNEVFKSLKNNETLSLFLSINKDKAILETHGKVHTDILQIIEDYKKAL